MEQERGEAWGSGGAAAAAAATTGANREDDTGSGIDKQAVREIIVYIIFMVFFFASTTPDLMTRQGDAIFRFGDGLKDQLTGVEVHASHSPSFAKAYHDVATVQELYHWMMNPLSAVLFSLGGSLFGVSLSPRCRLHAL